MNARGAEVAAARTAIRRQHGYDSYYVGSHEDPNACEFPVIHEFVIDDSMSTAYVWFIRAEPCIVLKGPDAATPAAALSWAAARRGKDARHASDVS